MTHLIYKEANLVYLQNAKAFKIEVLRKQHFILPVSMMKTEKVEEPSCT